MNRSTTLTVTAVALALVTGGAGPASATPLSPDEHEHPRVRDTTRFTTSRSAAVLPLPGEEEAFFFVVFGDRTGGPAEGVGVLADAVRDVNLLEPDLVMTVGDLIEGYNERQPWLAQMREYKSIMDGLLMPWFPVAGNHDVYWRGPNRPEGEHESDFERHFGPLWYAFEHKDCWFIALYSDEGDPLTGRKTFNEPASQVMSAEQFSWLEQTLAMAAEARHVFLFLHHPRWLGGGYGDDWRRVHALLAAAGNVRAVFGGHIHRMRYDGPRDGIEYITLATTGGAQSSRVPEAGYLHHFHVVTVRPDHIAVAAVPVGEVLDVRAITGEVSTETAVLSGVRPQVSRRLAVARDGSVGEQLELVITNPVSRPVEVTLAPESRDSRWRFSPDHNHRTIPPAATRRFGLRVLRLADSLDVGFEPPEVVIRMDYLAEGFRYSIPESRATLPLAIDLPAPPVPTEERVLLLDGRHDYLEVANDLVPVPDGPLTLECWFNASSYGRRTGLITKTENSEYGLFVSEAVPSFSIFLGDRYAEAKAPQAILDIDRWHHVAGVFDGAEARLYVDGRRVAAVAAAGPRRRSGLPLLVGADVDGEGRGGSHFNGRIDGVRLSAVARYAGASFTPVRRATADGDTVLLLNMDGPVVRWLYDESGGRAHALIRGAPRVEPSKTAGRGERGGR